MTITVQDTGYEAGIPGISDMELEVMLQSATDFLDALPSPRDGTAPRLTLIEPARAIRTLLAPAAPGAAGRVSAQRDTYKRQNGMHFMYMTPGGE